MDEIKLKLRCDGGTLLVFYLNENNGISITQNNYKDIATLTVENINQLRAFLNDIE